MALNLSQNNHLFFGDFLLFSTKICIFAAGFHNNKVEKCVYRLKRKIRMKLKNVIIVLWGVIILASCATPKTVSYFPDLSDGDKMIVKESEGILLKPADKLSIIVNTKSVELNNVLNLPVTSQIIGYTEQQSIYQSRGISSYTIDPEGYIDYPLVGKVKAAGLTRSGLADFLKSTMAEKNVAKDAVISIEYINLGYSVLGEVRNPGFYLFDSDKVTLLHALSKAGDMTIYGDRNNVKVIRRTDDGQQEAYVLNMQDTESIMKSPAYILQQNDVVYIQPNNYRKRQSAIASDITNGSFWLSAISVLTSVLVLIFK
jgi:polysaccharide export outer membrane protein